MVRQFHFGERGEQGHVCFESHHGDSEENSAVVPGVRRVVVAGSHPGGSQLGSGRAVEGIAGTKGGRLVPPATRYGPLGQSRRRFRLGH
eukprot:992738-Rhodomonas_salina.1